MGGLKLWGRERRVGVTSDGNRYRWYGSVLVVDRASPLGCDGAWTRDAEDQRNELG